MGGTNRSHFHVLAQPEKFPTDRNQPDHFEYKEDNIAEANKGSECLAQDGYDTGYYAQVGDTFMEDAFQHHNRDDQDADREQDTAGIYRVSHGDKTFSGSRVSGSLYSTGCCHVLIAQEHQGAVERLGAAIVGQANNLRSNSD